MNPRRIHAINYRTYAELDLDLPTGCVAIVGPNGAGKSSLINAIDLCLFGSESRSFAGYVTDGQGDLELELEFEHAADLYRVRRTFKNGKATLDFERLDEHEVIEGTYSDDEPRGRAFMPLTRETTRETQDLIERTVGLSRATFRASSFLAQGAGGTFCEATAGDRKDILAEVLGLSVYDRLQELARDDIRAAKAEHAQLDGETATARQTVAEKDFVEQQIQMARDLGTAATADLEIATAELDAAQKACDDARGRAGERAAAAAAVAEARREVERLETLLVSRGDLADAAATAHAALAQLPAQERVDELEVREHTLAEMTETFRTLTAERARARTEHQAWERALDALNARRAALDSAAEVARRKLAELQADAHATCDRCEQDLPAGPAREAAERSLMAEARRAAGEAEAVLAEISALAEPIIPDEPEPIDTTELDETRVLLRAARAGVTERASITERLRNAETTLAAIPDNLDEIIAAACADYDAAAAVFAGLPLVDLARLEQQLETLTTTVARDRDRVQDAKLTRARYEERLAVIHNAEQALLLAAERTAELQADLDVAVALERAFGPNGIPALILENSAIPFLETRSQDVLARLGGKTAAARVEFRTQTEKKTGGVKDTLDIVVHTGDGTERLYEHWSGGEKTRLELALRYALAQLLAGKRGAESRLFAIDEPDGLDLAGKTALVALLRDAQAQGLDRVYLISHDMELRDALDESIEVRTDGRRSWLGEPGSALNRAAPGSPSEVLA